jgi:hypothetical protein
MPARYSDLMRYATNIKGISSESIQSARRRWESKERVLINATDPGRSLRFTWVVPRLPFRGSARAAS